VAFKKGPQNQTPAGREFVTRFAPSSCLLGVAVHEVVLGSLTQETFLISAAGAPADHFLYLVAVTKGVGGKHGGDNRRMFDTGSTTNRSRGSWVLAGSKFESTEAGEGGLALQGHGRIDLETVVGCGGWRCLYQNNGLFKF
jgi:hypothetical protein